MFVKAKSALKDGYVFVNMDKIDVITFNEGRPRYWIDEAYWESWSGSVSEDLCEASEIK